MSEKTTRREMLAIAGGLTLGGSALAVTPERSMAAPTEESFTLLEGTDRETTGYVKTADEDGPTTVVVGGMHGNEVAGYEGASRVRELPIERGRLVTVPRANVLAIEDGTRTGPNDVDLNRQFPACVEPTTELARAIWDVVTSFDADVVVDLHESIRLYEDGCSNGVGQAIFHSPDPAAEADARETADYVNESFVSDPTYEFDTAPFSLEEGDGLFVHKVARETGADAFLAETLSTDHDLDTRIQWHTEVVRSLTDEELRGDQG